MYAGEIVERGPVRQLVHEPRHPYTRLLFAATPDAKARKIMPAHFSFNVERGRCPTCQGTGVTEVDMQFMAPVTVTPARAASAAPSEAAPMRAPSSSSVRVCRRTTM